MIPTKFEPIFIRLLAVAFCCFGWKLQGQRVQGADSNSKSQEIRVEYNVVYGDSDEPMHRADIFQPRERLAGSRLPGVLFIHGGAWTVGDKRNDMQHAKRLASLGFIVMAINYRLAPADPYPSQIEDCWLALEWLHRHSDELGVDPDSVASWGYSAGGHLSALLATNPKPNVPRLKACVVGGAPCDLTLIPEDSTLLSPVFGGTRESHAQVYIDASPVTHVSSDDPPMFLFHGSKDWLVPPNSSQVMQDALKRHNVPFEYLVVPSKAHLMTFIDRDATERSYQFLCEQLKSNELNKIGEPLQP
jgi:acetyl esterase/lipase